MQMYLIFLGLQLVMLNFYFVGVSDSTSEDESVPSLSDSGVRDGLVLDWQGRD